MWAAAFGVPKSLTKINTVNNKFSQIVGPSYPYRKQMFLVQSEPLGSVFGVEDSPGISYFGLSDHPCGSWREIGCRWHR